MGISLFSFATSSEEGWTGGVPARTFHSHDRVTVARKQLCERTESGQFRKSPESCTGACTEFLSRQALWANQNGNCWHTQQFSSRRTVRDAKFAYEWPATAGRQAKDLRDTELGRVRKLLKTKGENRGDSCTKSEPSHDSKIRVQVKL